MKLTGAAILVSRGKKVLQAAPAAYPYRSASEAHLANSERYETVMGSCHGGMFLELWAGERSTRTLAFLAFYSDADGSIEFQRYRDDIPSEVQERFRKQAHERLPPRPAEPDASPE